MIMAGITKDILRRTTAKCAIESVAGTSATIERYIEEVVMQMKQEKFVIDIERAKTIFRHILIREAASMTKEQKRLRLNDKELQTLREKLQNLHGKDFLDALSLEFEKISSLSPEDLQYVSNKRGIDLQDSLESRQEEQNRAPASSPITSK